MGELFSTISVSAFLLQTTLASRVCGFKLLLCNTYIWLENWDERREEAQALRITTHFGPSLYNLGGNACSGGSVTGVTGVALTLDQLVQEDKFISLALGLHSLTGRSTPLQRKLVRSEFNSRHSNKELLDCNYVSVIV